MIYFIVIVFIIYTLYRLNTIDKNISDIQNASSTIKPSISNAHVNATLDNIEIPIKNTPEIITKQTSDSTPLVSRPTEKPATENRTASIPTNKQSNSETEFKLGGKVFTGVGVIAVLLGVGFFLRYAFENNLISQGARVFIGCIFGAILIGIGHYLRKKYASYGTSLIGAGLGMFYLSIYAAYSFYQLIDPFLAFVCLTMITAASVCLALWYDSKPLVGFSFAGAFIMPFLLPFSENMNTLFVYIIVVNAGALFIARYKVWPVLTIASLIGTSLIYVKWLSGPYTDNLFTPTIVYCTIIFLSYFTTSLLNFIYRDRNYQGVDAFLLYATPIAYFLLNLQIMKTQDSIALLAFVIGMFNFIMFCIIRFGFSHIGDLRKFSEGILFMATIFIAGAVGLHFEGSTLTIMWTLQAAAMTYIGYILRSKINSLLGVGISVLVGLKILFVGVTLPEGAVAIFNGRGITLLLVTIMYIAIWAMFHYEMLKSENDSYINKDEGTASKNIAIVGTLGTILLWINLEAYGFITDYLSYMPLLWILFGIVVISVSFFIKEKLPRFLAYPVIITAFMVMIFDQWHIDPVNYPLFFNTRLLTAVVLAIVCGVIVKLMKMYSSQLAEGEKGMRLTFLLLGNLAFIWAGTLEILTYFNQQLIALPEQSSLTIENTKRVTLSIFWLLYALAGLGIGIFMRSVFARYFSICLFGITIFKIFLYDTANLSDVYRFVSFIVLGIILLIVGFSYYRFKDRIEQFVNAAE